MKINTWTARMDSGLSLVALERLTGIGKTTLNNIENGKVCPRLDQLEAIARATGRHISDLYESDVK